MNENIISRYHASPTTIVTSQIDIQLGSEKMVVLLRKSKCEGQIHSKSHDGEFWGNSGRPKKPAHCPRRPDIVKIDEYVQYKAIDLAKGHPCMSQTSLKLLLTKHIFSLRAQKSLVSNRIPFTN